MASKSPVPDGIRQSMRPHLLTKMLVFRDCSSKGLLESHA